MRDDDYPASPGSARALRPARPQIRQTQIPSDETPTRAAERHGIFSLAIAGAIRLARAMKRPVRLFHVSDLHFGQEDRSALAWFAEEVVRERPDAVVCTGDLTMRGRPREFAAAAQWLASLGVPVSVEPGNHDMPYYWDPLRRLMRPYARFRAMRAAVHSEIELEGLSIVPLKTVARAQLRLNWSKGRVSPRSLGETLSGISAAGAAAIRLVACHHPLVDAGTHSSGSTRGGRKALAALAAAGVDAVLSGHVHDAFDLIVDAGGRPIRLIGAGTLSERLRASDPGFNEVTIEDGRIDVRQHTASGKG